MKYAGFNRLWAVCLMLLSSFALHGAAFANPHHHHGGDKTFIAGQPKGMEHSRIWDNFETDPNKCYAEPLGIKTNILVSEACRDVQKPQKAEKYQEPAYREPKGFHYNLRHTD